MPVGDFAQPGWHMLRDFSSVPVHSGSSGSAVPSDHFSAQLARPSGVQQAADEGSPRVMPPIVRDVLRSAGQQLKPGARVSFEDRFCHDFSHVRVHDDARASAAADAIDAEAFTVGHDIVFASGRYAPMTTEGRHLLAHELAHTIQAPVVSRRAEVPLTRPDDPAEQGARQAADAVEAGRRPALHEGSPSAIYRQPNKWKLGSQVREAVQPHGRGELDNLMDKIIVDGKSHHIQTETIAGVEHVWEVVSTATAIMRHEASTFRGAMSGTKPLVEDGGKRIRHRMVFMLGLKDGKIDPETVLHELVHLRLSIDKDLEPESRSSFSRDFEQMHEMVTDPALGAVTGMGARHKDMIAAIEAMRAQLVDIDIKPHAATRLASDDLTNEAIVEFLVQEKYVNQLADVAFPKTSRTTGKVTPISNETVARRYAANVRSKFADRVDDGQLREFQRLSPDTLTKATTTLEKAVTATYDEVDREKRQIEEFKTSPSPAPPTNANPRIFESAPATRGE